MKNILNQVERLNHNARKINLSEVVTRPDFLDELYRASRMSALKQQESGFGVYTNEDFSEINVNRAVPGKVAKDKELHMTQHYMSTELAINAQDKAGLGMHVPIDHYTLLFLHFHPGNNILIPSGVDIAHLLYLRKFNETLLDASETEREVYKNQEEPMLKGYEIDYVNPVGTVCSVGKCRQDLDLIFFQGITRKSIDPDKFLQYAARYCNKLEGRRTRDLDANILAALGYFHRFRSRNQVLKFLNSSKYLQAVDLKIRNRKLKNKDLEKLRKFELVQTRFYKEKEYTLNRFDDSKEH